MEECRKTVRLFRGFHLFGHAVPTEPLFLFCGVAGEKGVGFGNEQPGDSVGYGGGSGIGNITGLSVGNDLAQPAYARNDHRFVEVIGDLCDAALGGAFIGLYHHVGSAEERGYLPVGDKGVEKFDAFADAEPLYLFEVRLFVGVKLAGNQQYLIFSLRSVQKERPCVQQQV